MEAGVDTAAGDAAAADDCACDGCSAVENGAVADGCAIGEACGESVVGDDDEAASAARNEDSSAAERGTEGDNFAADDRCSEADDTGGASAAIFGVASAEGTPGGDPAMAVDAGFADAAFVDATADMPAGGGTSALVAIRLTADAGSPSSLALGGAFNGAAADAGIDRSEEHTSELQSHVNLVC